MKVVETRNAAKGAEVDLRFAYYQEAGTMFLNSEPLIKGVPAKLLLSMLRAYVSNGKTLFFLSEFKVGGDPAVSSNLEARLERLARRLEERPGKIRLERMRGCRKLVCEGTLDLEEV